MIDSLRLIMDAAAITIPGTPIAPLGMIGPFHHGMWGVLRVVETEEGVNELGENFYFEYYKAVPMAMRAGIVVMLTSMLYITLHFIENTVEIGSII